MPLSIDNAFVQKLVTNVSLIYTRLFVFIEDEAQHIPLVQVEAIKVVYDLSFTILVVPFIMPDLEFDDIASAVVVDDHIHPISVDVLTLNVTGAYTVNDGGDVCQELFPALVLEITDDLL